MEDLCSDLMDESEDFDEFDEFLKSFSPAFPPRPLFKSEMEDLCLDLMDESEDFDEFDEFLESFDAPRYFDFTAIDNSRPDSPSWFCARIGCNQNHEQVEAEALDRSFKHRVTAARAPALKRQKPPKPDRARPTPKYIHSAPVKPAASVRVGSAASTRVQKQFTLNKIGCHVLTSNKGKKPDSTNSKDLVLSEMPNSIGSICSISKTKSIVSETHASSQITHTESVENAMDANKENVPNATCLEENCDKPNLLPKGCGNQHEEREKRKRMTIPKPFKLLTNERRIQREANLEKNLNSEAKRETVSTLRCRDGMKSNQIGKRVQKPHPTEAKVARGKMVKLAENKLIKRKAQCHKPEGVKEELGEKSPEEIFKGTSSKQSVRTQSLMAPRNAQSPLANRNKVIKANACLPVKKSLTAQQATGPAFVCRDGVTEKQIDRRVQKNPQPSEAGLSRDKSVRLARQCLQSEAGLSHDKSVRLARAKLITSNPQCQKENQIDKRVQKPQASETRLAHCKSVRLARAKLITNNPQCHKSESSKDKLHETSHKEVVVKVASLKQPLKAQSLMALRNAHSSSTHGNKVITANVYSQVKKSVTAQGVTGSAIVSRDGHNQIGNCMQKPQRIKAGLDLSNMAGDILMTENSQCQKVASSSTRQRFKTSSLIEARIASSSSTQGTTFIAGKAAFSQWKKSATAQRLTASAIRCPDGSKKNEIRKTVQKSQPIEVKLAHSKMVRFVGDNSIVTNPQCQKTDNRDKLRTLQTDNKDKLREKSHKEVVNVGSSRRLNSPSPMAGQNERSCAPHWDEVITEKRACSPERRPVTISKDANLHVRESCLNEPEMAIS